MFFITTVHSPNIWFIYLSLSRTRAHTNTHTHTHFPEGLEFKSTLA